MITLNGFRLVPVPALSQSAAPCQENKRLRYVWLLTSLACLALCSTAHTETTIRSPRARRIAFLIWESSFASAIDSCNVLISDEANNPLGYCLLGITYHSINSQYRTNRYSDSVMAALDTAISIADAETQDSDGYTDVPFVRGSAYGYRALEQSSQGHWWAAFKDGHRSCKLLQAAFKQDSSLTDALLGIGDYHYWKSAKSKIVRWLPFVKDRRQLGISEIQQVTRSGGGAALNAVKSLVPIYLDEQQDSIVVALVDSLNWSGYTDPSCLLHKTKAEIGLGNWKIATQTLAQLHQAWQDSPYFDSCGACEAEYLKACIFVGRRDENAAHECIENIYSRRDSCQSNTYFRETVANAGKLLH